MPDLIHGVDLQRAIAEKKGWKDFFVNDAGYPCGRHPEKDAPRPLEYDPTEPEDIIQFHALLDELVAEGWVIDISLDQDSVFICGELNHHRLIQFDAPSFCTAVGNLWLRCQQ